MSRAHYGPIDQIGFVVEDLDAAVRSWSAVAGLGPWTVFRNAGLDGIYGDQKGHVTMDVAMAYQGEVQIEIIQPTNDAPSPYRGADGKPLVGIHHVAWLTDDLDAELEKAVANGLRPVFRAHSDTVRVAYCEADGQPGTLFEFIESEATRKLIEDGRIAARDWDGTNPIFEIDLGGQ